MLSATVGAGGKAWRRVAHLPQQVARRFGLGKGRLGQLHPQFALDAGKQFHARQAVEAVITLQHMIQSKAIQLLHAWTHLTGKCADDGEQAFRGERCLDLIHS